MEHLELARIRRDGGTQPRATLDEATIAEYVEALQAGAEFPPVDVFNDGERLWLADGFHRVVAHERAGKHFVLAIVHQGDQRAAVLFSTGVNADHGLRRNNADKRRAVEVLLRDAEWGKWNDSEIARQCKVSRPLVVEMRLSCKNLQDSTPAERTVSRAGTTYTMNTGKIGTLPDQIAFATPEQLQGAVRSWLGQFGASVRVHILAQIALQNDVGRDRLVLLAEYAKQMQLRGPLGDLKKACAVVAAEREAGVRGQEAEDKAEPTERSEPERGRAEGAGRQTRCMICSRVLDDPDSVARGYGPECAEKVRAAGGQGQAGLAQGSGGRGQESGDAAAGLVATVEAWLAALVDNAELADDADGRRTALYAVAHRRQNGGAPLWASLRKFAGNGAVVSTETQRALLAAVRVLLGEEDSNAGVRDQESGNGGGNGAKGGELISVPAAQLPRVLPARAEIAESARLLGVLRRARADAVELRDGLVAYAASLPEYEAEDDPSATGALVELLHAAQKLVQLLEAA